MADTVHARDPSAPGGAVPGDAAPPPDLLAPDKRFSGPRVIIVGGGFAGIECAKALRRTPCQVILVDRHNYHLFQPLLYQVATAALSPSDIGFPIRRVLRRQRNAVVGLGTVDRIDPDRKILSVNGHELSYDYLVLAAGATNAYFGHPEWQRWAPSLKTMDDAVAIRSRMLASFEIAEVEDDPAERRRRLTFVIVGGGPTGVELAGAIKELAVDSIARDFRRVDTSTARVLLVEGGPRLLPSLHPSLSEKARRTLERMGVEVRVNAMVTSVDERGANIGNERIDSCNVLWAAGVQAASIGRDLRVPLERSGQVPVEPDLSVRGHPEILVVGDLAHLIDSRTKLAVPGVAPAAMQMGRYAAKVIDARIRSRRAPKPFAYFDKGSLATIGRAAAVADIRGLRFSGFFAWLLWGGIHVAFLIGFRNRFITLFSWVMNYVLFAKGSRLITGAAGEEAAVTGAKRPVRDIPS